MAKPSKQITQIRRDGDVLSWRIRSHDIGPDDVIDASFICGKDDQTDLAKRFNALKISAVRGRLEIRQIAAGCWQVQLTFSLSVTQECVVSFEPVETKIEAEADERFVRNLETQEEIDPEELDVDVLDDGAIPLGEVIAQNVGLNLPEYPRSPSAPTMDDEPAPQRSNNPFQVLSELKNSE